MDRILVEDYNNCLRLGYFDGKYDEPTDTCFEDTSLELKVGSTVNSLESDALFELKFNGLLFWEELFLMSRNELSKIVSDEEERRSSSLINDVSEESGL